MTSLHLQFGAGFFTSIQIRLTDIISNLLCAVGIDNRLLRKEEQHGVSIISSLSPIMPYSWKRINLGLIRKI
jgi:hypothetical protein